MRRSRMPSLFIALMLSLWPASAATQNEGPKVYSSPDARVTVEVPEGAAPPEARVAVETRDPGDRPAELAGLPMPNPFYELRPLDARFSEPVLVTRLIEFEQLGIDAYEPTQHGLVVGTLFTRDSDGVWSWLDDAEVRVDPADNVFVVTGSMDHGGPIIGLIGANLVVAATDPAESAVGEVFQVEGLVRVEPESAADITAASGSTSDPAIADLVRSYDVEAFERAAGLEFECLAPGTVTYEVAFTVTEVADVSPLGEPIGLAGTGVDVVYTGEHTCLG
jgi:hypothetical protein